MKVTIKRSSLMEAVQSVLDEAAPKNRIRRTPSPRLGNLERKAAQVVRQFLGGGVMTTDPDAENELGMISLLYQVGTRRGLKPGEQFDNASNNIDAAVKRRFLKQLR